MALWVWLAGIMCSGFPLMAQSARQLVFSGELAYGAGSWTGTLTVNQSLLVPSDPLDMTLSAELTLTDADLTLPYTWGVDIGLRPLYDAQGQALPSDAQPPIAFGLPVLNVTTADIWLTSAETTTYRVDDDQKTIQWSLKIEDVQLPTTLANGTYAVVWRGYAKIADSDPFNWYTNRIFSTLGTGSDQAQAIRVSDTLVQIGNASLPSPFVQNEAQLTPIENAITLLPTYFAGRPFVQGQAVQLAVRIKEDLTNWELANARAVVTQYTLDGVTNEETIDMDLTDGILVATRSLTPESIGVLRVEYVLTLRDATNQVRTGTTATVSVILGEQNHLLVHGRRGIEGYVRHPQAWFDTAVYPLDAYYDTQWRVNFPYFSGDTLYIPQDTAYTIRPIVTVEDVQGDYEAYLQAQFPAVTTAEGDLPSLIQRDALPLIYPNGFAIISVVKSDGELVTQFIQGNVEGNAYQDIPTDAFSVGDVLFLVGGVVLTQPTPLTSAYIATAVITADDSARVTPLINLNDNFDDYIGAWQTLATTQEP